MKSVLLIYFFILILVVAVHALCESRSSYIINSRGGYYSSEEEDNEEPYEDNDTPAIPDEPLPEEEIAEENVEEEPAKVAKLQFMITNKMRKALEQDLGYLSSEVDDMDPQVAAIVIERTLRRPSSGMPASWLRPEVAAAYNAKAKGKILQQLQSTVNTVLDFSRTYVRPVLPVVIVTTALWLQRDSLAFLLGSAWNSLANATWKRQARQRIEEKAEAKPRRGLFGGTIRLPGQGKSKGGDKVDLASLNKVYSSSWMDDLGTKSKAWRMGK